MDESPFYELPQSLVEEMLSKCDAISTSLSTSFVNVIDKKEEYRSELSKLNLLCNDTNICHIYPTTCGIDGSYTMERLLSSDMVAMASIAIEGLTPPSEKRYWQTPRHLSDVKVISHSDSTNVLIRAIMMDMELELANQAPHDVVFFDGSLTTPFIYLNQGLGQFSSVNNEITAKLQSRIESMLDNYKKILQSEKSDQIFVGVPKYTTKKEITENILKITGYEDRGFLTFILKGGEYIKPIKISTPSSPWHLNLSGNYTDIVQQIISSLNDIRIIYYRPNDYFPAFRLEVSNSVASNNQRLAILLEAIKLQCNVPGIMEPYPLYLADRMVKHLQTAIPAIRKTTTQEMAFKWKDNIGDIYLAMHAHRTG